ncbi:DUF3848 domain-containing protein [Lachnospiraceae bacterium 54-11]|uniref:DUF3848 domain-containing protein n=2 Tax=uncultured Acetatifactor sp. TaxID=1671927 RepID=UPI00262FA39D|nr:DUF3848 domain-containing protein [uncultured Acetatifactor sp.]
MKTIYRDEIYEVIAISPMDEDNSCQVSLRSDRTGRTLAVDALCHDSPGCAEHPLAFIRMGLSDRQTLALIREFDTWYANTGQDLRDWAAEFQLIVRMLLCGYMVANPQYLELDEVIGPAWETIKGDREGLDHDGEESMDNSRKLKERLGANYEAYIRQLQGKPAAEIIEMAPEIAAAKFIYGELAAEGAFAEYAGYLLQFENPLEVLRDSWQDNENCSRHEEIEHMLWNMKDKEIGIGDYPLAGESTQGQGVVMC